MKKEDVHIYDSSFGLNGTIPQLVDWAYRYSEDYSSDALCKISQFAELYGFAEKFVQIPLLVKAAGEREKDHPETLPYEQMKLDYLVNGMISFSRTMPYGECEISLESGKVLLILSGSDENGCFTAANSFSPEEFMSGENEWLERAVGETLYYGRCYNE